MLVEVCFIVVFGSLVVECGCGLFVWCLVVFGLVDGLGFGWFDLLWNESVDYVFVGVVWIS